MKPHIMTYDDDIGTDINKSIDGTGFARAAVEQWPIKAVGKRPVDFLARDLLIASLFRDPQQWLFRCLSATPPSWIGRHTSGIDGALRKQANQISAVHFLHAHHLQNLCTNLGEPHQAIVTRLLRCLPSGFLIDWNGPGRFYQRDVCDLARVCPWCLARRVVDLYGRLQNAWHSTGAQAAYFLARIRLSDEAFAVSPDLSLRDRCQLVRKRLGLALIQDARAVGAEGGLTTFTVAPKLSSKWTGEKVDPDPNAGFEFRMSLLGRIPTYRPELASLKNSGRGPALRRFDELGTALTVDYQVLRGRQALRLALAGSSCDYVGPDGVSNVTGIFSWPSWNLSDARQWATHLEATRGMRLFDMWGSWKGRFSDASRKQHVPSASSGKKTPKRRNAVRQQVALERRESLFHRLEGFLDSDPDLHLCGHVKLRKAFKDQGIQITQRDAKWLCARMLKAHKTTMERATVNEHK
jgi:hypothetical protein